MITNENIREALAICEAASKGPAVWAADKSDTVETALERFRLHYEKAREVSGSAVLHQVDLPDSQTEVDGTSLCFAVTGNGPKGADNARFIAGALHPDLGWAATLRELERLSSALEVVASYAFSDDDSDASSMVACIRDHLRGVDIEGGHAPR